MQTKRTFIPHLFYLGITMAILLYCVFPISAQATSNNTFDEYEAILEQVNADYNQLYAITDRDAFENSIMVNMSLDDFQNMLIKDAVPETASKQEVFVQNPTTPVTRGFPDEVLTYFRTVTNADRQSLLHAKIRTATAPNYTRTFLSFVSTGPSYDPTSSAWTFFPSGSFLDYFSSTSCRIIYQGVWKKPSTGLTDLGLYTYTVTFTP